VIRLFRSTRRVSLSLAISAALLLSAGVAGANAATPIEGVWSFNGGAVDIVGQPNGTLIGMVTVPTKFALCVHPANEQMWIEMRPQADGSYWGFHRWYFEPPACLPNPTYGPTAWRILQNPKGESFLRVCFSAPGSNSQPTIAPDGSSAHVNYGCVDSAAIAPLPVIAPNEGAPGGPPGQIGFDQSVKLPSAKPCVKSRTLKITLRDPKYDPLKEVVIRVNGKKVADVRGTKKLRKAIVLKHLPNGSYTVKVLAITVLNQRLSGSRKYKSCTKGSGKIKLNSPKVKQHK